MTYVLLLLIGMNKMMSFSVQLHNYM